MHCTSGTLNKRYNKAVFLYSMTIIILKPITVGPVTKLCKHNFLERIVQTNQNPYYIIY